MSSGRVSDAHHQKLSDYLFENKRFRGGAFNEIFQDTFAVVLGTALALGTTFK